MHQTKISITLDEKVAKEVREVAGPRGVSAFVNEALRQALQAHRLRLLLDEQEMEFGPIPDDIQREVDALPWPD